MVLREIMYYLIQTGRMKRCFLLTGNIDGMVLCAAGIKMYLPIITLYFGTFNARKNVLWVKELAVDQQIIFNKGIMSIKRCLVIVSPTVRAGQVMNKI